MLSRKREKNFTIIFFTMVIIFGFVMSMIAGQGPPRSGDVQNRFDRLLVRPLETGVWQYLPLPEDYYLKDESVRLDVIDPKPAPVFLKFDGSNFEAKGTCNSLKGRYEYGVGGIHMSLVRSADIYTLDRCQVVIAKSGMETVKDSYALIAESELVRKLPKTTTFIIMNNALVFKDRAGNRLLEFQRKPTPEFVH